MSFKVIPVLASLLVKFWQSTEVPVTHFSDESNKDLAVFIFLRFKFEVCKFLAENPASGKNTKCDDRA